jgi:hypothetical protein
VFAPGIAVPREIEAVVKAGEIVALLPHETR